MIFNAVKWALVIRYLRAYKQYIAALVIATIGLSLIGTLHQEMITFLKETARNGYIEVSYYIKWLLQGTLILTVAVYIGTVLKSKKALNRPNVSAQGQESKKVLNVINKRKLSSLGDSIIANKLKQKK